MIQQGIEKGKITGKNNQPLTSEQIESLKRELKVVFKKYVDYFRATIQHTSSQEKEENKIQELIKHPQATHLEDRRIERLPHSQQLEQADEKHIKKVAVKILISTEIILQKISERRLEERREESEENTKLIIRKEIIASEIKRETINQESVKSEAMISEVRKVQTVVIHQSTMKQRVLS